MTMDIIRCQTIISMKLLSLVSTSITSTNHHSTQKMAMKRITHKTMTSLSRTARGTNRRSSTAEHSDTARSSFMASITRRMLTQCNSLGYTNMSLCIWNQVTTSITKHLMTCPSIQRSNGLPMLRKSPGLMLRIITSSMSSRTTCIATKTS